MGNQILSDKLTFKSFCKYHDVLAIFLIKELADNDKVSALLLDTDLYDKFHDQMEVMVKFEDFPPLTKYKDEGDIGEEDIRVTWKFDILKKEEPWTIYLSIHLFGHEKSFVTAAITEEGQLRIEFDNEEIQRIKDDIPEVEEDD